MSNPTVRPVIGADRPWLRDLLVRSWGLPVVTPARAYDTPDELDGVVAEVDGERVGCVTWSDEGDEREVVTLNALRPRQGVGRALMAAARSSAAGLDRVWLVTTDDNPGAIAFYVAVGMTQVRVLPRFIDVTRAAKPEVPADAFRDAIEFEWRLA